MMRTTTQRRAVPELYEHARIFVAALHAAGARIVAGSDANSAPGAPAAVAHQTGIHDELALLVDIERGVSATAREPTRVLKIARPLFRRVLEEFPDAAHRMRGLLARRVSALSVELRSVSAQARG